MIRLLLVFLFLNFAIMAKDVPTLTGPVVDQAGIFSSTFEERLGQYIRDVKNSTGTQLQVLTVTSLEDEALESYTIKVVDKWKLGDAKEDKGLLFFIALNDRKMRIEVGQGLEGEITDILAGRLIDQAKPYFRQGDYEGGTFYIMDNIGKLIGGTIKASSITRKKYRNKTYLHLFWIFIFFLIIFLGRGKRSRSSWIYYSGGGSSWGGSSGGGWSGGGGGFSGGGSSGSW